MRIKLNSILATASVALLLGGCVGPGVRRDANEPAALTLGRAAVLRMSGCYLVDYNYHETKPIQAGYAVDQRVYDVNSKRTVMEWIFPLEESARHVRLQHVLFAIDENGKVSTDSLLRHQAEDWEFEPAWAFEYQGTQRWTRVDTSHKRDAWARRITNLDDGPRYQCVAPWVAAGARTEWTCGDNFAPIPGRETRDMKRKDYNTMLRETRLIVFPTSWVEKQRNEKILLENGERKPLAEEAGRNWYIRVPDAQCAEAAKWSEERVAFWRLLEDVWAGIYAGSTELKETPPGKGEPRFAKIGEVEEKYYARIAGDAAVRDVARKEIQAVIDADRAGAP